MPKTGPPPSDAAAATLQKQRQRRYHQRSRNGCITCKKRHVRCDEARPLCMNCLRTGGECGYTDPFVAFTGSGSGSGSGTSTSVVTTELLPRSATHPTKRAGQQTVIKSEPVPSHSSARHAAGAYAEQSSPSLLDMTPKDSLAGLMLSGPLTRLPARSRWLFHTFAQRSIQDRPGVPGPTESFAVHRALANPGMLHVCLSLSAIQHLWAAGSGSWDALKLPLQYHKAEAYRFVRQQIENPKKVNNDTTITTVASLALLEASLWEIKSGPAAGSLENIMVHLTGLQNLVKAYLKPKGSAQTIFQRAIFMGIPLVQHGIVMTPEIASQLSDDVYQPIIPSLLFMSLWPDPLDGWWNSEVKAEAKPWFATTRSPGQPTYQGFKDIPTESEQFRLFRQASRNAYYTAFLYMCLMLREGALSSFILKLLIDQLLDDVERTAQAFSEARCNQSIYFWTVLMTLAAVASAPSEDKLEAMQIITWQKAIADKVRLANRVLGLTGWESAKAHLRLIAWQDGFDGEDELRRMWEDIALQDNIPLAGAAGQSQTTLVLLNSPVHGRQHGTGLLTPEDTVTPESTALEK